MSALPGSFVNILFCSTFCYAQKLTVSFKGSDLIPYLLSIKKKHMGIILTAVLQS